MTAGASVPDDPRPYRPGVGIMLINRAGLIFVGNRIDVAGDHWQMPQGGIDEGETAEQAAWRELAEEAGTDKAALRDAIAATEIDAATGHISFNGLGEVRKDVQVQVVRDGNWHHYAVISDPVLLAPPTE